MTYRFPAEKNPIDWNKVVAELPEEQRKQILGWWAGRIVTKPVRSIMEPFRRFQRLVEQILAKAKPTRGRPSTLGPEYELQICRLYVAVKEAIPQVSREEYRRMDLQRGEMTEAAKEIARIALSRFEDVREGFESRLSGELSKALNDFCRKQRPVGVVAREVVKNATDLPIEDDRLYRLLKEHDLG